jgi:hypothetical protein
LQDQTAEQRQGKKLGKGLHDTPPRFGYGIELSHESGTATKKNKEIIFVRVLFSWEKTYLLRVIGPRCH